MAVTEENVGCAGQVCIGLIMFGMFSVVTSIMFIGIGGGTGTDGLLIFGCIYLAIGLTMVGVSVGVFIFYVKPNAAKIQQEMISANNGGPVITGTYAYPGGPPLGPTITGGPPLGPTITGGPPIGPTITGSKPVQYTAPNGSANNQAYINQNAASELQPYSADDKDMAVSPSAPPPTYHSTMQGYS